MQALTALIQIFYSLRGNWEKVNLFRNRVNVLRNRDNLFSITSQQFPPQVYTTQLHSYAVTQLHKV